MARPFGIASYPSDRGPVREAAEHGSNIAEHTSHRRDARNRGAATKWVSALLLLAVVVAFAGWAALQGGTDSTATRSRGNNVERAVPVEVVAIGRGPMQRRRALTGTLMAHEEFVVAPKVAGRVERIFVVLEHRDDARFVPQEALVRRDVSSGVFRLSADGERVAWRPVTVRIRDGSRVEIAGDDLGERVVVLGQHLLEDGSAVAIESSAGQASPEKSSPGESSQ